MKTIVALLAALPMMTLALAQDVAMGAARAAETLRGAVHAGRRNAPRQVGQAARGRPIRLLAVPTVGEGRTLVELAQRLSLDLTTVSIDPDWDVNKWTMSFGDDYGARAEKAI